MGNTAVKCALIWAIVGGCTSDPNPRPPIDELHDGLNMIDVSDPTWGAAAAYVKDGHVVYLEQRMGALKPQLYREAEPTEPANEMDMRFVDETGKTFFVQRGGDTYVDDAWNADINASLAEPAPDDQRVRDFVLAREAAAAFGAAAPAGFDAFKFHALAYAARPAPSEDIEMMKRVDTIEASRPADSGYATWGGSGSWWLEGDLYDKKVCYLWVCVARHSGVAMWAYQTSWQLAINACNHGSCPGWSNMTYRCYSTSGRWVSNPSFNAEANANTTAIGGGCRTPYNWNSGGYDHLCNDDTAYELWQVKNGNAGTTYYNTTGDGYHFAYNGTGTGGDGTWVNYACNCSTNNSCNNDWSRPICP